MKIKSSWTQGLDEQKAKEVKASVLASEVALKRLGYIIRKRIESNSNEQRSKTNYDDPNWSVKQADYIGSQRTYKEILDLVDIFLDK